MTSRPDHVIAKELEAMKKPNWREVFENQFKWGVWPKGHPLEGQKVRIRKSNNEPVGFQQYRKEYFAAKNAQGLRIRKGEHVTDPGLKIAGPGSGKGRVKFARDKKGKLVPHPVHGRPMTVTEAAEFAAYEASKKPKTREVGKDGVIKVKVKGTNTIRPLLPKSPLYNHYLKNPDEELPPEVDKDIKDKRGPTTGQINQNLPSSTKEYKTVKLQSRDEREHNERYPNGYFGNNKSLTIQAGKPVKVVEESGAVTTYKPKPNQIGRLRLNPGGLVGRYDDVRRSDGRSTALSIAQEDFMGIKKGENLGVLTRSQRNLYDREVLKIGG